MADPEEGTPRCGAVRETAGDPCGLDELRRIRLRAEQAGQIQSYDCSTRRPGTGDASTYSTSWTHLAERLAIAVRRKHVSTDVIDMPIDLTLPYATPNHVGWDIRRKPRWTPGSCGTERNGID